MRPKREMKPVLSLAQNFHLAMREKGLTFDDLSQKSKVSRAATYKIVGKRGPVYPTEQALKIGVALGFTRKQVKDKINEDRLLGNHVYSKREAFYNALRELIEIFESK